MKKKTKVFFIIILCLLSLSIFPIYQHFFKGTISPMVSTLEEEKNVKVEKPSQEKKKNSYDEFKSKYQNNNIVAFLDIPGLLKDVEPVVQADDNDHYLHYNIYEKKDINGATFLDYRNTIGIENKILIYGHSNSELSLPLSSIYKYSDSLFFENHKDIYLYTKDHVYQFEVFSSYVETEDFDYVNLKSFNGLTWMEHLEKLKKKSEHKTDIKLEEGKKVIILQTCSQEKKYKNYSRKYRLVLGIEK